MSSCTSAVLALMTGNVKKVRGRDHVYGASSTKESKTLIWISKEQTEMSFSKRHLCKRFSGYEGDHLRKATNLSRWIQESSWKLEDGYIYFISV